jgi:hypothetical protein
MHIASGPRTLLFLAPFVLVLALIIPYAFFTSDFRVLIWAIQSFYMPFWSILMVNFIGALISGWLLYRLHPVGLRIFEACGLLTLIHVAYLAMLEKRHGVLVIAFVTAVVVVAIREWALGILSLPYFQSNRNWWEAKPKSLPNLSATLVQKDGKQQDGLVISNLGEEGCFIFGETHVPLTHPTGIKISEGEKILFSSNIGTEYRTSDGFGMGLRFQSGGMETDLHKEMADFIGVLRRRGYVD